MKIRPFEALGYRFEDLRGLQGQEKIEALGELLRGIKQVPPELRCPNHPLRGKLDFDRPEKYELTAEEAQGDLPPIHLVVFSGNRASRTIAGIYCLYGIRVILQTQGGIIVRARPWPTFNNLDDREWASLGLDIGEALLENDLILEDERVLFFEGLDFSIYYLPEGDPTRGPADLRMESLEKEYKSRRKRKERPLRGKEKKDRLGRKLIMIDKEMLIHKPSHVGS